MNRRAFMKRGALFVPAIFIPKIIHAQTVLTAPGLVAFGRKPAPGGSGGGGGGSPIITSGLKLYYKFDEGSGTSAGDASGNGFTGTLSGTTLPTWATGYIGAHALSFNGSSSYVTGTSNSSLDPGSGDLTLTAWFKTSTTANMVIAGRFNSSTGVYWIMEVDNSTRKLRGLTQGEHGSASDATGTTVVNDGTWRFATMVIASRNVKIYQNGSLEATAAVTTGTPIDPGSPFIVGQFNNIAFFNGSIDEVAVYNRALTGTEITTLYNQSHP